MNEKLVCNTESEKTKKTKISDRKKRISFYFLNHNTF